MGGSAGQLPAVLSGQNVATNLCCCSAYDSNRDPHLRDPPRSDVVWCIPFVCDLLHYIVHVLVLNPRDRSNPKRGKLVLVLVLNPRDRSSPKRGKPPDGGLEVLLQLLSSSVVSLEHYAIYVVLQEHEDSATERGRME